MDATMRELAGATATELELFCERNGLTYANERDHLSKCCKTAVRGVIERLHPRPTLGPFAFGEMHQWTGLGLVDIVLRWDGERPVFLELKCGRWSTSLRPCVWDAVKLATAVHGENARGAYLLAGAPASVWAENSAGADLFDDSDWETAGERVRARFMTEWRRWEKEPHIPGRVPERFRTRALGMYSLRIADVRWELRLARVEPVACDWIDWETTLEVE